MNRKIFINLPVKDLPRSMAFFGSLGFTFNQQFTDETAACMIISDDICAMLLTHEKFASFTDGGICDARNFTEVMLAFTCEHRHDVEDTVRKAIAAGGSAHGEFKDHGFMVYSSFRDLDGHIWEPMYLVARG